MFCGNEKEQYVLRSSDEVELGANYILWYLNIKVAFSNNTSIAMVETIPFDFLHSSTKCFPQRKVRKTEKSPAKRQHGEGKLKNDS